MFKIRDDFTHRMSVACRACRSIRSAGGQRERSRAGSDDSPHFVFSPQTRARKTLLLKRADIGKTDHRAIYSPLLENNFEAEG